MSRSNTLRASAMATAVVVSMLAAVTVSAAPGADPVSSGTLSSDRDISLDREGLSQVILEVWETQVAPMDRAEWRDRMSARLAQSDLHNLRRAADALDHDEMLAALSGVLPGGGGEQLQSICDLDQDHTFTPVEPCRIVDTRIVGGRIGANEQRDFIGSTTTDFTMQGGSDSDCDLPQGVAALSMNLTTVAPDLDGYAIAFPFGVEPPLAASVNYTADSIVGNEVVVPMAQGLPLDFSVYTFRSAHVVADVTGYYMRPQASRLDCTQAVEFQVVEGRDSADVTATCRAGYSATGAGCFSQLGSDFARDISITYSGAVGADGWRCAATNHATTSRSIQLVARCCRMPGR